MATSAAEVVRVKPWKGERPREARPGGRCNNRLLGYGSRDCITPEVQRFRTPRCVWAGQGQEGPSGSRGAAAIAGGNPLKVKSPWVV